MLERAEHRGTVAAVMIRYLILVKNAVKTFVRMRGGFIGPGVFLLFMFVIEGSFWWTLSKRGQVGDYDFSGLLFYTFAALIGSQVVACLGDADSLSEKIEIGALDAFLLRPIMSVDILLALQIGDVIGRLLMCIPMLIVMHAVLDVSSGNLIVQGSILFVVAGLMNGLINNLLATFTFWLRESYAFVVVKETLFWMLSGSLFPLDLLPSGIRAVVTHLPMSYVVFGPVQVLVGKSSFFEVLCGQLIWIVLLKVLCVLVFNFGKQRYQAYGS